MIKSIDKSSVHRISSGQVLVDLQTAIKELVENSLDAGATNIEVRLKDHGVRSIEVIDNGTGISPEDYDHVGRKHYTSKISSYEDLNTVLSFGFRGEALSSLCALSERVTITTATSKEEPLGTILELDKTGALSDRSKSVARKAGTTVSVEGLFKPLPVRRKEFERNAKREFAKALTLLTAYALIPCANENKGVRLSVSHQTEGGKRTTQLRTDGLPSTRSSISALWGPKQLESLAELNLKLDVTTEKAVLRRQGLSEDSSQTVVEVHGYISKFSPGHGRAGADRQFFYVNGRPCSPSKIQKAFNEVYRSFNTNQSPFIVADFVLPTDACDINVSPDKRTILIHSEDNLVAALKESLEKTFATSRSTFAVQSTLAQLQTPHRAQVPSPKSPATPSIPVSPAEGTSSQGMGKPHLLVRNGTSSQDTTPQTGSSQQEIESGSTSLSSETRDVERQSENQASAGLPTSNLLPTDPPTEQPLFLEDQDQETPGDQDGDTSHMDIDTAETRPLPPAILPTSATTRTRPRPSSPDSPGPIINTIPAPTQSLSIAQRRVQLVLDTSNASWNIRRPQIQDVQRPSKKPRTDESTSMDRKKVGIAARQNLREQLAGFAKRGTVVKQDELESEEDGEEVDELDEETDEVRGKHSTNKPDDSVSRGESFSPVDASSSTSPTGDTAKTVPLPVTNAKKRPMGLTQDDPIPLGDMDTKTHDPNPDDELLDTPDMDVDTSYPLEIMRTVSGHGDTSITVDLNSLALRWESISAISSNSSTSNENNVSPNIFKPDNDDTAERELSRVIHKEDFTKMEIVGQFNLGFIIARKRVHNSEDGRSSDSEGQNVRDTKPLDDLFIIDQHAADEKYNFEKLQAETKIESQRLFAPRPLELTAAEELVALENLDALTQNGFEVSVDEGADPGQGRIKLVSQPVSKNTTFDMKDLEELLHLLQDHPTGAERASKVRPSKVRAMFASRACRKSIMIGKSLTKNQMTTVVRHMGTMEQPWNCPHGRPTMRHLVNLSGVNMTDNMKRVVDWNDL